MKIATKLNIAGLLIIGLFALTIGSVTFSNNRLTHAYERIVDDQVAKRHLAIAIQSEFRYLLNVTNILAGRVEAFGMQPQSSTHARSVNSQERLNVLVGQLQQLVVTIGTPAEQTHFQQFHQQLISYLQDVAMSVHFAYDTMQHELPIPNHTERMVYERAVVDELYLMIEHYTLVTEQELRDLEQLSMQTWMVTLVLTSVALGVMVLVIYRLKHQITRPLTELTRAAEDISKGVFGEKISHLGGGGEPAQLANAFYEMEDTIHSIVQEIGQATTMNAKGGLTYRIEASRYSGEFKELVTSVNELLDINQADMDDVRTHLINLTEGFVDNWIDEMEGEKQVLSKSLIKLRLHLYYMIEGIQENVKALQKGDFSYKLDQSFDRKAWLELSGGIIDLQAAVQIPLEDFNQRLASLAKGEFERVSADYQGLYGEAKDHINKTVDSLSGYVNDIAQNLAKLSEGDLTYETRHAYVGQFVQIFDSLRQIQGRLLTDMSGIKSVTEDVVAQAALVKEVSVTITANSSEQQQQLGQIVDRTDELKELSNDTVAKVYHIEEEVKQSNETLSQVEDSVQNLERAMSKTTDSASQIQSVLKAIEEIAFQTNLLSLNASVEAARAGEAGRGFAVVAEEVRALALRSEQSSKESETLLGQVLGEIQRSYAAVKTVSEQIIALGMVNTNISSSVKETTKAIEAQEGLITGIVDLTRHINDVAGESYQNAKLSEEKADQLNYETEILNNLIGKYKLQKS